MAKQTKKSWLGDLLAVIINFCKKFLGLFGYKTELDKRITEYQNLLEKNPRNTTATRNLAEIWARAGNSAEAAKLYGELAAHFETKGFYRQAIATLDNILRIDPNRLDVYEKTAELFVKEGVGYNARGRLEKLTEILEGLGREKELLTALEKIAELEPQDHLNRLRLAEKYSHACEHEKAAEQYRQAAAVLYERNRLDDFVKAATAYLALAPANKPVDAEIRVKLASVLSQKSDQREPEPLLALEYLKEAHKADPKDHEMIRVLEKVAGALRNRFKHTEELRAREMLRDSYKALGREKDYATSCRDIQRIMEEM